MQWKDDFYFIHAADTQFGQFERLGFVDRDQLEDGKKPWYKEVELAERAVEVVNSMEPRPKFMVFIKYK